MLYTNVEYFEHWKITTTNYGFISIVDLKLERDYSFQVDSDEIIEKYEELNIDQFLDWFYDNELDLSCDHKNYNLTQEDLEYLEEE
ncbi:MAG: hypothetical protein ACTSQS_11975 [Promethearchaeota archaeon]